MFVSLLPKHKLKYATRLLRQQLMAQIYRKQSTGEHVPGSSNDYNNLKSQKSEHQPKRTEHHFSKFKLDNPHLAANEDVSESHVDAQSLESCDIMDGDLTDIRKILYKELIEDDILNEINNCCSYEELLSTITRHSTNMQLQHRVQSTLMFCYLTTNTGLVESANHNNSYEQALAIILQELQPHISAMTPDELSCCYYYLCQAGVVKSNKVLRAILSQALDVVDASPTDNLVPLTTLSRLSVTINIESTFFMPLVCQNFIPHIIKHIENCKSQEDARLLAICCINLQPLISIEILDTFKNQIQQLLETNKINGLTPKPIVKLLNMLNLTVWSTQNTNLIRDLMLTLLPSIEQLNGLELKHISRIFHHHFEPAAVLTPLKARVEQLLQHQPNAETLSCYVPFTNTEQREDAITLFKQLLKTEDWSQPFVSHNLFLILRALKIGDVKVCNDFWQAVLNDLDSTNSDQLMARSLRYCHQYLNFNNNLGGTYRYIPLEQKLSQLCMHAIQEELEGRIPHSFARFASFVLAYGHTPFNWKKFPNIILSKIISMASQFSIIECFLLSRGAQTALELRFRNHIPFTLKMQLSIIDSLLTECAERHLNDEKLNINDLNLIVRMLINRKSLKNSMVYHEALNKYKEITFENLNSRVIRDVIFNLNAANFLIPQALDSIFDYIAQHYDHVTGEIVEKVLTCSYNLGYTPKTFEALSHAAYVLLRDFNHMSGLSMVQACLALCYYKSIPADLIDKVFCVKFIQRIDEEISKCYSRATYPERVLNMVMQLNRTVCLDFPEANVPWFQQSFVESQLNKVSRDSIEFREDVHSLLKSLLKDETHFRCNHTTPYGYQIDFVIHFDRNKHQPIPSPVETTMLDRITKVAILLLKLNSFCENDLTALRGPTSLKMKHLEMMGYKVLHINEHDWNSKYMNAPGAKTNYLKCLLQITN